MKEQNFLKITVRLFFISSLFIIPSFWNPLFAQSGPGSTGAVELKIPVGPRAIAMGEAFVAVANDANAIYWNPAGLVQLGGTHFTAQYDLFIETVQYSYFALGTKLGNDAAIGAAAKILGTGTDPATDSNGNLTGGTVGENYFDVDLAGAYRLSYYFDMGLVVKYISKSLASVSNSSDIAFDIGVLYRTPIPHLTAGMDIQNLGPGMKFDQVSDPLPLNFKVGLAYRLFDDNFTTAFDMNIPNDNAIMLNLGGEYWYQDTLVGRFGYEFQGSLDQNQLGIGGLAGMFLGAGVKIPAFKNYVGLDYAWTNQGILGANHHFALDFYF
jgi:long-subunit fatty acid transport protein